MRRHFFRIVFIVMIIQAANNCFVAGQVSTKDLPLWPDQNDLPVNTDWLIKKIQLKATVFKSQSGKEIIVWNGLVKRTFRLSPDAACIGYRNMISGQEIIRAVKPEARIVINGASYNVGGLSGQKENGYLKANWIDSLSIDSSAFHLTSFKVTNLEPFLPFKPNGWMVPGPDISGKSIAFNYKLQREGLENVLMTVHYEIYDGIPLMVKWISVVNEGKVSIKIDRVVNEVLGYAEEESAVVGTTVQMKKQHGIYIETNYAFNNAMRYDISDQTTHWKADSSYTSQVNYDLQTPCLLEVYPDKAPGIDLSAGEMFRSVRTHELLMDSYDRERRGLAIRRMYAMVAPWTRRNPIFMHLVSKNDGEVKTAIDQCAATGYEAVILSFGSHCDMEDTSAQNISRWKKLSAYAHQRNMKIGAYSLFSSRQISDEDDVIDPVTHKPDAAAFFGHAPCMGSRWGLAYINKLEYFMSSTNFDLFENDGPYPGDVCASVLHPGHKGLDDSQWKQMELQKGLYHWCNAHGIYVNAPDWYFLDGTNKIAIGYREVNFSLSRDQQKILNRQNIYDGLWEKTSSMSWGFVPLTKYQGGGPEAVLEPLSEHLNDYTQLMMQYYGAGVQACYRGPRLFDNETTRQAVSTVISWYKQYRDILNSDIIHLRRADGRDWDGFLHVNPFLKTKALLMIFNPLDSAITRSITVPLYYSGLAKMVTIKDAKGNEQVKSINRDYVVKLNTTIAAGGYSWFTFE